MPREANDTATLALTCALIIAVLGGVLLFVHEAAGAILLGLSLFPLPFGIYGLGVKAWRVERAHRPRPGPGHADGMPE